MYRLCAVCTACYETPALNTTFRRTQGSPVDVANRYIQHFILIYYSTGSGVEFRHTADVVLCRIQTAQISISDLSP